MRVLAIDPGYERLGLAVVERSNSPKDTLIHSACFKTSVSDEFPQRLRQIGDEVERFINIFEPSCLAIEDLFFNTNQKTAMQVAHVCGAIIYLAKKHNLEVRVYTPSEVKVAVTGYGKSDKAQVTEMVKKLIDIKKEVAYDDEYDAIGVAITCLATTRR